MNEIVRIKCYIEEYIDQNGNICARLRDKETNKKVIVVSEKLIKNHLLIFLSQARINKEIMPTIYDRNGSDIVVVRGCFMSDTSDEIEICIDVKNGGYLFE